MSAVRRARAGETEELLAAYEWLFAPPGSEPAGWDPERALATLEALIAGEDAAVFVAERDAGLAGLCTVYLDIRSVRFGQRAWVEDLAVHPEHRSLGVGRELLQTAMGWAREHGATHLELDSSTARTDAHRFYEREAPSGRSLCFAWAL